MLKQVVCSKRGALNCWGKLRGLSCNAFYTGQWHPVGTTDRSERSDRREKRVFGDSKVTQSKTGSFGSTVTNEPDTRFDPIGWRELVMEDDATKVLGGTESHETLNLLADTHCPRYRQYGVGTKFFAWLDLSLIHI